MKVFPLLEPSIACPLMLLNPEASKLPQKLQSIRVGLSYASYRLYIPPPSELAELPVNVQLDRVMYSLESLYIPPPSSEAVLFVNVQSFRVGPL